MSKPHAQRQIHELQQNDHSQTVLKYFHLVRIGDSDAFVLTEDGPIVAAFGNVWNEAFNSKDINQLTCDSEGDLISYSDFTVEREDVRVECDCATFEDSPTECHTEPEPE